jgi:hypothetical protein
MIDLTNKTIDEINGLIQKYAHALELVRQPDQPYMAYIINVAYAHLQDKHKDLNKDWKAWTIVVLKNLCRKINNDSDIQKIVDEFVEYQKIEYKKYVENLIWHNEIERDWGFVYGYIHKKIGR